MADELNGMSQGALKGLAQTKTSVNTLANSVSDGLGGLTKLMDVFLELFNTATSGIKGIVDVSKIEKPQTPMKSDWVKFSPLENFIRKQYPNPISYSSSYSIINAQTCEELVTRLLDMLEAKKLEFSLDLYPIDEILIEYLGPMLSKFLDMFSLLISFCSFSVSSILQVLTWVTKCIQFIFDMISWIMAMLATPLLKEVDQLYVMYRQLKVTAAIQLFAIKQYTLSPCVLNCEYSQDQSQCPALKKLKEGLNSAIDGFKDSLSGSVSDLRSQMKDSISVVDELKDAARGEIADIKTQATEVTQKVNRDMAVMRNSVAMKDVLKAREQVTEKVETVAVLSSSLLGDSGGLEKIGKIVSTAEMELKEQKLAVDVLATNEIGASVLDSLQSLQCGNKEKCPVQKSIDLLASIIDAVAGFVDGLTMPIDTMLELVNTVINIIPPITMFMPRQYPPVKVVEAMEILQKIVEESKEQTKNGIGTNPVSHGEETETGQSLMQWSAWGDVFKSPFDGLLNNTPEDKAINQIESDIAFNNELKKAVDDASMALLEAQASYNEKMEKKGTIPAEDIIDAKMQMEKAQGIYNAALNRYQTEQKKIPEGYEEWNSALPNMMEQTGKHWNEMVSEFTDMSHISEGASNFGDTWNKTFGEERDAQVQRELEALEKKNEEIKEHNKNILITEQQARIDAMNKDLLAMGTAENKAEKVAEYMRKVEELENAKKELERIKGLSTKTEP